MRRKNEECISAHDMNVHVMSCHDSVCHEQINSLTCNHDMSSFLNKADWRYLVDTLEQWKVFAPRAVVKRNPALAWRIMNLCKDPQVRVKGAYFTACFRRELIKIQHSDKINALKEKARTILGITAGV